jgi:hypothetical protein
MTVMPKQLSKAAVGLFGFLFASVKGEVAYRLLVSGQFALRRDESVVVPLKVLLVVESARPC